MMNETQYDPLLFSEFFGSQSQAFVWLQPVWNEANKTIIDFKYMYSNKVGLEYFKLTKNKLQSISISNTPTLTDEMRESILNEMIIVYETGITSETKVYNPIIDKHGKVSRMKFRGGILTVVQDNTEEIAAIRELNEKTKELEHQKGVTERILDASLSGVFAASAIYDHENKVVDFLIQRINPAFTSLLNLTADDVIGKRFLSIFPKTNQTGVFDLHSRVLKTGIAEMKEIKYPYNNEEKWFIISSVKLDDGILVTFNDITENKQATEQIEKQKNLLDNILSSSANGISVSKLIRNDEGKVIDALTVMANDAAVTHSDISKDILFTKIAIDIDPGILDTPYYQMCMQTLETGISTHVQYFLERTAKWIEISISRMDEDHLITIFTDVTTTKEAQLAIERSSNQLQLIINKTPSGIFTITPVRDLNGAIIDFSFVIVNEALASYKNVDPKTLIGELCSTWFSGYKTNGLFDKFYTTFDTGVMHRFHFHYKADGIDAWIDIMCTPIDNQLLVTFTDYTPIKQLQLELEKSIQELKYSNTNLEEFAYIASHDLQEPLRKIQTFSERLKKDLSSALTPENNNLFQRIDSATVRMRTLIDDVLSYSKVSASTSSFKPVDLETILQQVLQDLETTITETNAIIKTDRLPIIRGDESQLTQLFQNVIGNALKYRKHGIPPHIFVLCTTVDETNSISIATNRLQEGKYYLIEISDNGIGFEQEYSEKIFHVFQRLHGRSEYQGTGVGLAIVQKVVTNHGGLIFAESEPGKGATFKLMLPVT